MFELKGEFVPAWAPGTVLLPDVDGNEGHRGRSWEQGMRKPHQSCPSGLQTFHLHSLIVEEFIFGDTSQRKSEIHFPRNASYNLGCDFCVSWLQCGSRELEILGVILNQRNCSLRPLVWRECHSFGTPEWLCALQILSPLHCVAGIVCRWKGIIRRTRLVFILKKKKKEPQTQGRSPGRNFVYFPLSFYGRWEFWTTGIYRFMLMYKKERWCKNWVLGQGLEWIFPYGILWDSSSRRRSDPSQHPRPHSTYQHFPKPCRKITWLFLIPPGLDGPGKRELNVLKIKN